MHNLWDVPMLTVYYIISFPSPLENFKLRAPVSASPNATFSKNNLEWWGGLQLPKNLTILRLSCIFRKKVKIRTDHQTVSSAPLQIPRFPIALRCIRYLIGHDVSV